MDVLMASTKRATLQVRFTAYQEMQNEFYLMEEDLMLREDSFVMT